MAVLKARSLMTAAVQQELEKPQRALALLLLGAALELKLLCLIPT